MTQPTEFVDEAQALAYFDQLPTVTPPELIGLWQGATVRTGHALDGMLEDLGWYGKRFHADRRADALLFSTGSRRLVPVNPAHIPLGLALKFHRLSQKQWFRNLFSYALKSLWAKGTVASVRIETFRGKESAAMAYDQQPITDHFRRIDDEHLMGVMAIKGQQDHYIFTLVKVTDLGNAT